MADTYNPATGELVRHPEPGDKVPVISADHKGPYAGPRAEMSGSVDYEGTGSFQPLSIDLNVAAGAGSSDDPKYIGPVMGNVLGDLLTKTKTYIGALIGKYSITGAKESTYPHGAIIGEIGDGVTGADGAVVAVLGGDSEVTTARAAFTVDNQNSTPGSAFGYGLDLRGVDHDGYGLPEYSEGAIRFPDGTVQDTAAEGGGASYLVYTALLNQSGTDAPVATIMGSNTIGVIDWTRNDEGLYNGNLSGAFPANKTWIIIVTGVGVANPRCHRNDDNTLDLTSGTDGAITDASIEIRVYP